MSARVSSGDELGRPRRGPPWASARWALPVIFLLGYLTCSRAIGPLPQSFLWLTVLNAAALALLLTRLGDPLEKTLWVWSVLFVFMTGVFLKMYWFAWKVNTPRDININYAELRWVDRVRIFDAYPWASLGFVAFCLTAWMVLTWRQSAKPLPQHNERVELTGAATHLVVVVFLVYLAASLLQYRLGYGVLGVANPALPGGLGTLLTFLREQCVPALLLLCLWILDRDRHRWAQITAIAIVLTGLIGALISTSRGILPATVAPMLLVWLLTGRMTRQRKMGCLAVAMITLVLFPIVTADRDRKLSGLPGGRTLPSLDAVVDSAFFTITRPSGIEGIWHGYDHRGELSPRRVLDFLRPHAMTDYYTYSVVRVRTANDFRAPGLIGALMIIGGGTAVLVLMIAFVLALQCMWGVFSRLQSWPVALSLAAPAIAIAVSGGVEWQYLLKVALQAGACEIVYRKVLSRRVSGPAVDQWAQRAAGAGDGSEPAGVGYRPLAR